MTSQSSRRPYKAWSNAELDAMTEIYATGNLPELAERFGVSMQQLRDKASHMGLRREKGTKTSPDDNEPEPDTEQRTFFGKQTIHHQPGGRVITHTMRGG